MKFYIMHRYGILKNSGMRVRELNFQFSVKHYRELNCSVLRKTFYNKILSFFKVVLSYINKEIKICQYCHINK